MSQIKDTLQPISEGSKGNELDQWDVGYDAGIVRSLRDLSQLDTNLDLLRQCVQSLLNDCQSVLNRQSIGVSYRHEWEGISLNAVRDIKQRAGVMLRLLDGEVVV